MKIRIPIWGLIDTATNEIAYWGNTRKNCMENKWAKTEKLIKLEIRERKK